MYRNAALDQLCYEDRPSVEFLMSFPKYGHYYLTQF